jgi:hypothetical protein
MGFPTSEVGYTSATTRRETTKSIWTFGGIGLKKKSVSNQATDNSNYK